MPPTAKSPMTRFAFLFSLISFFIAGALHAQPFPQKPEKIIAASPAGITPDVAARVVAERLSKTWGQAVVLEPRPGGNGFIAIGAAKKAAPDGYELLLLGNAQKPL